jgi:hypothetical protein
MHPLVLAAATIAMITAGLVIALMRTFYTECMPDTESVDTGQVSYRDYPFHRLLDPADFEFLRRRGASEKQVRKLRAERRRLFRLYLRSLARDFHQVHRAIKRILVQARVDRPDLAVTLARQQAAFYRNMLIAEVLLFAHACGWDNLPAMDLLEPLNTILAQFWEWSPSLVLVRGNA